MAIRPYIFILLLLLTACAAPAPPLIATRPTDTPTPSMAAPTPPPIATAELTPTETPTEAPTATASLTPPPIATAERKPTLEPTATKTEVPWETKLEWAVRGLRLVGFTKAEEAELRGLILEYFPKIKGAIPTREEMKAEFPYIGDEHLDRYEKVLDPLTLVKRIGEIINNKGDGFHYSKHPGSGDQFTYIKYDEDFNTRSTGLTGEAARMATAFSTWKEMVGTLSLDYEDPLAYDPVWSKINDCVSFSYKGLAMKKAQEQGWGVGLGTVPQRTINQAKSWAKELEMVK